MSVLAIRIVSSTLFALGLFPLCGMLLDGPGLGTRKIARVGVLLSMALVLGLIESFLPDFLLPGMRLGLANVAVLLVLCLYGYKEGLMVAAMKALLVSLLRGNLFAMGGLMALSGSLLSFLVMALLHALFKKASVLTLSVAGALFHAFGQILVARIYLGYAVWGYLPYLLLFSFGAGILVGLLCTVLLRRKALRRFLTGKDAA